MNENQELIAAFVEESIEGLDAFDQDLVELEKKPDDHEVINKIFRVVHSMKGTGSFFEFEKLVTLSHTAENLLDDIRGDKLQATAEIITILLETSDVLRKILHNIDKTQAEGEIRIQELLEKIHLCRTTQLESEQNQTQGVEENPEPSHHRMQIVTESSIRVDIDRLDRLMNLVGELVLCRNQVLQYSKSLYDTQFAIVSQRLSHVTTDLQEIVMQTRMQPIERIWGRYPRVIRTLANSCNKKVRLIMTGEDTEIDKTLLEIINDPLTHILRNSIDHGIEDPEYRLRSGKPEEGTIYLSAYQEGGQIIVEIRDDGKGINASYVKQQAVKKGIITEAQSQSLSDRDAINLIFVPGFSTVDTVTDMSGRGVGMDVVKEYIEHAGGVVELTSEVGVGTCIQIKLPLTLAIMPGIVLGTCKSKYVVHQASLVELICLEDDEIPDKIEFIRNVAVYRLRGAVIPLICLDEVLNEGRTLFDVIDQNSTINIVVLQAARRQFGLVVECIHDTQEVVVKPLNRFLQKMQIFAGATILGDGGISLILDVGGIARRANVEAIRKEALEVIGVQAQEELQDKSVQFVVFEGQDGGQMGLPLLDIYRLEKISLNDIQKIGLHHVMQYQNKILLLIDVRQVVEERRKQLRNTDLALSEIYKNAHHLYVAVYEDGHEKFGLILSPNVDIMQIEVENTSKPTRAGVLYSTIMGNKITEVLNVSEIIAMSYRKRMNVSESIGVPAEL